MILDKNLREDNMKSCFPGRVRNYSLGISYPLTPIYEAVTNSLQAIMSAKEKRGCVKVHIIREADTLFSKSDNENDRQSTSKIVGFTIEDNGIGFTDENFSSFETLDSEHKLKIGGKGIGRISWLKVFKSASIESTYYNGNKWQQRTFDFSCSDDPIKNVKITDIDVSNRATIINLLGINNNYMRYLPKRAEVIAHHIMEHFIEYLCNPDCPKIIILDETLNETYSLNQIFNAEVNNVSANTSIPLQDKSIIITDLIMKTGSIPENRIYFCAHDRMVCFETITDIPGLSKKLIGDNDNELVYVALVKSSILDEAVNSDRTNFDLPEKDMPDTNLLNDLIITKNDIRKKVKEHVENYLKPYIENIKKEKINYVDSFLNTIAPYYKPLRNNILNNIDMIDLGADEKKMDIDVYRVQKKCEFEIKERGENILNNTTLPEDAKEKLEKVYSEITELNQTNLARYMTHRKTIIYLFERYLHKVRGAYVNENIIHDLIYPMRSDSHRVSQYEHNLWLVDDRLSYYDFCSSDKPFKDLEEIESDNAGRADICAFYSKYFVSEENIGMTRGTAVIIEFKKPQRDDYYEKRNNPFEQTNKYLLEVRNTEKIKLSDDRPMKIPKETPIYCYIICDLTRTLCNLAESINFNPNLNGGYWFFNSSKNIYTEIIHYETILTDAKKRHDLFFQMLGIPK